MRATVIHAPHDIRVEEVPDPAIRQPTDAVVRVLRACICGSDLWAYRGESARQPGQRIGHEFLGVVEETGAGVGGFAVGDLVVAPFVWSDGTCAYCADGLTTSCPEGGFWGSVGSDGGQGEAVRVPYADGTLVKLPAAAASDGRLLTALLALSDVLGTGHHAALGAGVTKGSTVAVVGDGAVGLCGVLAARRVGAERIIALGRHTARTDIARRFGATDVVAERGEAALAAVRELTRGEGAHSVIEAVGTEQSMRTALDIVRDGGAIGYVGVPRQRLRRGPRGDVRPEHRPARRRRPRAYVHPGAAPRRAGRHDRPLTRLRPVDRPGRGARRLPGRWTGGALKVLITP
ncbi:L-threonine 3-dehydrogenase [Streptomyces microflavus]